MTIESFNQFENSERKDNNSQDFNYQEYIPAPNNPNAKAVKLQDEDESEALLHSIEDEKKPINDFIEEKRKIWKEEFNSSDCIVFDLIKSWYSWEDIMDSLYLMRQKLGWKIIKQIQ